MFPVRFPEITDILLFLLIFLDFTFNPHSVWFLQGPERFLNCDLEIFHLPRQFPCFSSRMEICFIQGWSFILRIFFFSSIICNISYKFIDSVKEFFMLLNAWGGNALSNQPSTVEQFSKCLLKSRKQDWGR